jgi:tetratricopeptide (TPR) repeat protein
MTFEFFSLLQKLRVRTLVICLACTLVNVTAFAQQQDVLDNVRTLRLQGKLTEAQSLAELQIEQNIDDRHLAVSMHLELARIHDRIGLHHNTRPVVAALESIDKAASMVSRNDIVELAMIELARADYFYRAEMVAREFPRASQHAHNALEQFQNIEDLHGAADATHRLGLIHLQRGDLEEARSLFEESRILDRAAGERVFFDGEYERHVGFVYLLSGDLATAIPYFERSLAARIEAGAIDASMFAAVSLASALVGVERFEEAKPHSLYAMTIAEQIGSPAGKARAAPTLGQVYEQEGDFDAARDAFETALRNAEYVGYAGTVERMDAALKSLNTTRPD